MKIELQNPQDRDKDSANKPVKKFMHVDFGIIGHMDIGKTTATERLMHTIANSTEPVLIIANMEGLPPKEKDRGISIQTAHILSSGEFSGKNRKQRRAELNKKKKQQK